MMNIDLFIYLLFEFSISSSTQLIFMPFKFLRFSPHYSPLLIIHQVYPLMNRSTRPQPQKKGVQKSKILQRPKIAKKNRQSITPTAKRHIKTSSNRTRLSSPGSISQTQLQISTRMKNIVPQQLQLPHYYHNQHRSFSTNGGELDVFLQDSQRVVAVDPKDGSFNTNPGVITPSHLPKAQHVVSPHLRQYVHGLDETTTILPENIKRAPIKPEHLTVGYKYLLKHLKYIPDTNRRNALALQFRSDFDILKRATTIEQAQVQFDRSIPNLWSQLSVVRMGISKLRRPRIPEALIPVTEYLGAQEGMFST